MYVYLYRGRLIERLPLTKPYSAEAKAFIRLFYQSYHTSTTIAQMAREIGVPETTFRNIIRRMPHQSIGVAQTLFD